MATMPGPGTSSASRSRSTLLASPARCATSGAGIDDADVASGVAGSAFFDENGQTAAAVAGESTSTTRISPGNRRARMTRRPQRIRATITGPQAVSRMFPSA